MKDQNGNREIILEACNLALKKRRKEIEMDMANLIESLNAETKSSAGDKHETSRARLHLEQERLAKLLYEFHNSELELEKIARLKIQTIVSKGSVVYTDRCVFFLAFAFGKIEVGQQVIQVISVGSPLGVKMLGLKSNESFEVNEMLYTIEGIA